MELQLEQQQIPRLILCAQRSVEERFSVDIVIPDSMPDAVQLLLAEGDLCLWRLNLTDGSADLEGEIDARVCCMAEDHTLISMPARVPVQMRLRSGAIETGQKPFLQCRVANLSGQLLNSRKMRVQASVQCTFSSYGLSDVTVTTGIALDDQNLYVRKSEATLPYLSSVEEQVITAEETVSLQRGVPADGLLISCSSVPVADVCEYGEQRVIVKGNILTTVLYQEAAGQNLISETIETPFSGMIDVNGEVKSCRLSLHLTSEEVRCRKDDPAVDTSFHLLLQVICFSEQGIEYVSDAYSNCAELNLNWEDQTFSKLTKQDPVQCILEKEIPCDLNGNIICAAVADHRGEKAVVTVLLQNDNKEFSAVSCELKSEQELIRLDQPTVQPGIGGLIVRVPIVFQKESETTASIRSLISAEMGESVSDPAPGVTLVRRGPDPDYWTLAKENHSSVEAILAANPNRDHTLKWLVIPHVT